MYFTSANEDDDNTYKIRDYLEDIMNNYSKGIYINDSTDANMEGGNYKPGNKSHLG